MFDSFVNVPKSAFDLLWWPKSIQKYLKNHTCYNKIIYTILFSSRWWVYWYELFSVLNTLRKWQNFDETPSLYNKEILPILASFSGYEILLLLECTVDSEWNDIVTFIVSCSVVVLSRVYDKYKCTCVVLGAFWKCLIMTSCLSRILQVVEKVLKHFLYLCLKH